ncbi:nuclease [Streptomyces phage Karp]|nr:nuclease [Streptomyces phage Karp]
MKICTSCGENKSVEDYYLTSNKKTRFGKCKKCSIRDNNNMDQTPEYRRNARLWTFYRIRTEDFNRMIEGQDYKCYICTDDIDLMTAKVDHDHSCCPTPRACGKCNRGLLCHSCNTLLGAAKDSPETLSRAIQYLAEFSR